MAASVAPATPPAVTGPSPTCEKRVNARCARACGARA
jgi:hypothetical protein